jgi:hydrogenase maturation protease
MQKMEQARLGVLGIGNTLASDDGVGILAVRGLREFLIDERVVPLECERGGMDLLERLQGFESALIVDAARTGMKSPGEVTLFTFVAPFSGSAGPSLHTIDLAGLLAFGERVGMDLPREVTILAVEAQDFETFHEGCTWMVQRAIPDVVGRLAMEIRRILPDVGLARRRGNEAAIA